MLGIRAQNTPPGGMDSRRPCGEGSFFALPTEIIWMVQSHGSFFALQALRGTCRGLRDRSLPVDKYLDTALRWQLYRRARQAGLSDLASDACVSSDVLDIYELMRCGHVLSGGMLLAMLHRRFWPDSADVDLCRGENHVTLRDGTYDRVYDHRFLRSTVTEPWLALRATGQTVPPTDDHPVWRDRDWRGPTAKLVMQMLFRDGQDHAATFVTRFHEVNTYLDFDEVDGASHYTTKNPRIQTSYAPLRTPGGLVNITIYSGAPCVDIPVCDQQPHCDCDNPSAALQSAREQLAGACDSSIGNYDLDFVRAGWCRLGARSDTGGWALRLWNRQAVEYLYSRGDFRQTKRTQKRVAKYRQRGCTIGPTAEQLT